ncbi:HTH-type transcriptional repressor BdcR [Corynebacterium massiliense DSM 45435]|uniref:HTH-type transcriptional repressor BdcR n=2 Tax=Corynebacterium massiliense TaxID=441501 RepID=A0ABY7U8M8_9CORY|nr:HTH-type transcriptional repressor BdcR [Corynebacterium massiliense DSM 45435]
MKTMGRPREFEEAEVLSTATRMFGRRGFNALSVDAVLTELGLNRSSFYKIYGSKHGLFRAVLEAVCANAEAGAVDNAAKDFTVVSLVEVAPGSRDVRALTQRAVQLCFGDDFCAVGQHVVSRVHRIARSEGKES